MGIEIPKTYEPRDCEERLYEWWEREGFFRGDVESSRPPFSMVLPPPNVTGSLHMGHALNITLQDILARWRRMQGRNVLWVPGTDHAGIATQNVVERNLSAEGKRRTDLGRERFEKLVWEWKEQSEKRILRQIQKLGCSCDWSRKRFTMDEKLSQAVREVFVSLYEDGLIYRGEYLVNWCPRCGTAISDLEVEYRSVQGSLWYIKYPVTAGRGHVVVATTRPETMLGDTAVAVNPNDERYAHLAGKSVTLPLMERVIPIIRDEFVDSEFGTGVVKVTPGHDPADFEAGQRHNLPILKVIGDDGSMTAEAKQYAGMDRYEARSRVVEDLERRGLLETVERYAHNVGHCQRCETVVEPLVSTQWFVRVKPLAEKAIEAVERRETVFFPPNFEKVYFEWMRNIHDWCISRQLWWGHRIPAWYCGDCGELIVAREEPKTCAHCGADSLSRETDVLDTWFSSALWPFSTLGWPEHTKELEVYYPTSTMVTGFDIIFFWVARMMMMGLRFMRQVPFRRVCINGLVRDEHGNKMSKSRGNIIDPLEIIQEYGTDAVRFTLAVMAVPGTDIPFSVSRMAGYRAFCNKIWNAARFLLMNLSEADPISEEDIEWMRESNDLALEDRWILSRLHETIDETNRDLDRFFFHEASHSLYHFFWHELCDWYIEFIKADMSGDDTPRRRIVQKVAAYVLETSLRLLHPFIPFITEELWQRMPHRGKTIMTRPFPEVLRGWIEPEAVTQTADLQELITAMRTARAENNVDPRIRLDVKLCPVESSESFLRSQVHHIERLVRAGTVEFVDSLPHQGIQVRGVGRLAHFSLVLDGVIDPDAERRRLLKEKQKTLAELRRLDQKLGNRGFLEKAPTSVVEGARTRHSELAERLRKVDEGIEHLQAN